jgi:phage shock protein C
MRRKFTLDKRRGVFMGVCSGIATYFNIDPNVVRIGAVVVTLLGGAPWTFIAYGLAAWLAKPTPHSVYEAQDLRTLRSAGDVRDRMSDIDRRMAEVETYVTSQNSRLAREIEELR